MAARKPAADPVRELADLRAALEKGALARGYLLKGDERYFLTRGVDAIQDAAKRAGLELCRHDPVDPDFEPTALLDDLGAVPMFATGRCVVVHNPADLMKKVGGKDSPFTRAALAELADASRTGTLVLAGSGIRADHAIAKAVVKAGGLAVDCGKLKDLSREYGDARRGQLVRWIEARARELKLKLSNDDAFYLANAVGNDLSALDSELANLVAGGGKSVRESVAWDSGGTPWEAADALLSGDPARALAALEALFRSGFTQSDGRSERSPAALAPMILGTLRTKTRQGLAVAQGVARGETLAQAAGAVGVSGNWQLRNLQGLIAGREEAEWTRMVDDVGDLERAIRRPPGIDVNDFARLAVRWRRRGRAGANRR